MKKLFKCYEGHSHLSAEAAKFCTEYHWEMLGRAYPATTKPLQKLPAPPPGEQLPLFSDPVHRV